MENNTELLEGLLKKKYKDDILSDYQNPV